MKLNLKSVLLYAAYGACAVALNSAVQNVPLSLGLMFSMLICGANLISTPLIYVLAAAISLNHVTILLSLFEGGFLTLIVLIYRRTHKKIRAEAIAYMAIALAPFIALSRSAGVEALDFLNNPYIVRAIAALAILLCAYFAFRTVFALMFRVCRCKLRADELLCAAAFFVAVGAGLFNLIGLYAYICAVCGILAFAVRLYKSPSAAVVACVAALPIFFCAQRLDFVTAFTLTSVIALLFVSAGKFFPCVVCAMGGGIIFYFEGLFYKAPQISVLYCTLLFVFCLIAALPSEKWVEGLKKSLDVMRALPRAREERYREYVGDKLYKMSEVFREIECAFTALDEGPDDGSVKRRMLAEAKREMCANCPKRAECEKTRVYRGFASLIENGCLKGRVSFVDLTSDVTKNCRNPSSLTETVNKILYEYRKSNLEAENAKNGRKLLAEQAKGVAEVLKNRAAEFCRESCDRADIEQRVIKNLAASGISCPEISIRGDSRIEVNVVLVGKSQIAPVIKCVEEATGYKLMLKDKRVYDGEKCAYLLTTPPRYDAAFGVAYAVKDGEHVSGDTHSVIRINEHAFLMALSDGMGSGEYARRVSETAISLIEAFSRSEMPTDIVLDTINKLLCFNRDERFTCIDAATVDLNTLTASFIKIGSPVGLIVRKGEIKVLESRSLPLGILDNLHPTCAKELLKKNDIVVFMSDGVTSAFGGVTDMYEFISTLKPLNPQSLAEKILAAAKERHKGAPDDMTVLCVRVYEKAA